MGKQIAVVMLILMTTFIGFAIIIPVMPLMVQQVGAPEMHLGLLLAVYSGVSFIMSPFWGSLSDRIGRKPVIMIGLVGFCLSFLVFGLSSDNLWLMYVSRILGGVFSGATTASAVAYVADITTEENRTKGMGMVGMSIGMGFMFGPAVGGLLSKISIEFPFFISSGLAVLAFLFVLFLLKESKSPEQRRKDGEAKVSRWKAFTGPLKFLYVIAFFVTFTLAGLEATLQYFEIVKFNATPTDIGVMFLVSGIVGALIQGGYVRRIKKGTESRVIIFGLVISALGFFLLMLSHNLLTASIYLGIFSIGNSLIRPCVTSLITQKTTVGQGVASGLSSSMDSLGRIAGPLLGTFVYGYNIRLPFIIGGILCLAAVSMIFMFRAADSRLKTASTAG